jgi:hypothetical protein
MHPEVDVSIGGYMRTMGLYPHITNKNEIVMVLYLKDTFPDTRGKVAASGSQITNVHPL